MLKLCRVRVVSATGALAFGLWTFASNGGAPAHAEDRALTSVGFAAYGLPRARARRLRQQLREAAKRARLGELVDPRVESSVFDGRAPPDPTNDVAAARAYLDRAESHLKAFEIPEAKQNTVAARQRLRPHVGRVAARPQDRRRLHLAVSIAHAERDEAALIDHLRTFLNRFSDVRTQDAPWPPDVRARLERLRVGIRLVPITIASTVPAVAAINGRPVGPTPVEVRVPQGRHRIEVSAPGAQPDLVWIDAKAAVRVELTPRSTLGSTLLGTRALTPSLQARILAESAKRGIRTVFAAGPGRGPSGNDTVRIVRVGADPSLAGSNAVQVAATPEGLRLGLVQLSPKPAVREENESSVWPWVTVGAGVAAAGAGVAFRVIAQSTQDDFQARRPALTQREAVDLRDRGEAEATAGTALLGVGLTAVAGGLTWAVIEWIQDDQ